MSAVPGDSSASVRHPLENDTSPPLSPPVLRRASSPSTSNASTPSPSNQNNRHSVIGNFNNWISDLSLNLSPSALFHNLSIKNPFGRKSARPSPMPSPLAVPRSKSDAMSKPNPMAMDDSESKPPARFLNGTLIRTAKAKELIELASFGVVEVESTAETGVGHDFQTHPLLNPTWCDSCGEFMWMPVTLDNCINPGPHFQSLECKNCKFTCHVRCRKLVRIDCQGIVERGTRLQPNDESLPTPTLLFEESQLLEKIYKFNLRLKNKGSGLGMTPCDDGTFRGFIRVHLNLTRPINVIAGTRPPSIYDIIKEDDEAANAARRTLTSFYMPRDTVKNIHITSESTSLEVIRSMLKKFKVIDNPQKFALYQSFPDPDAPETASLSRKTLLKRIADQEKPLKIALEWLDSDEKRFVLQENDTADICWDAFALPELKNFLRILEREENDHITQLKDRYMWMRNELRHVLDVKIIQQEGVVV